jgi:TolB protein
MRRFFPIAIALLNTHCASRAPLHVHETRAEPTGCRLERVTDVGADDGHVQFHGPSAHDKLVVNRFRGGESGTYLLDLRTGERRDLPGLNGAGTLSEDGKTILIANIQPDSTTEMVEYDLATGTMRTIAPHPRHEWLGTYWRNGEWILFNSYRTGRSDIYIVPRTGGEPTRLTSFDDYDAHADASPDGRSILFHRSVAEGNYDIYMVDPETRAESPVIAAPGEQAYPAWSPDGRWFAFASDSGNAAGKTDIYITDVARTRLVRITATPTYNAYPAWSPDGRFLYFNAEREGKRNVYRTGLRADMSCSR